MTDAVTLKALLGDYPHTTALKAGELHSDKLKLEFSPIKPVFTAFGQMVRNQAFDISEMAIVTYLIAKGFNKPMVLLPATMFGRFQQPFMLYNSDYGPQTPEGLAGKRVGIRSFTTTTGAWARGILANDHGLDLAKVNWVTFEDPHVAEFVDTTQRAPAGKSIVPMLLAGELDAVIGEKSDDPRIKCLFGDPEAASMAWYANHKLVPVNHMVVVSTDLVKKRPDLVAEFYRLLKAGKQQLTTTGGPDYSPFGVETLRPSLELIVDYAAQQKLIPRRYSVEELFDDVTGRLG